MENDFTKEQIASLTPEQIMSVCSGKAHHCCCGCSGNHRYNPGVALPDGSNSRGYSIDPEEFNFSFVKKVLRLVQANLDSAQFGSNFASVTLGERLYVIYPVCK